MDAFISWTSADRDVKNVLASKLRDAGIDCWDSDREVTSNFAEECIAAVKRCQVFIVLVSDAAMKDTYVKNETTTAREMEKQGKLNIVVYKLTDSPYTDQFEFLLNHISFVTGNIFQRQSNFGGESSLEVIIRRVQTLLKKRKEGNAEKPFEVNRPEIKGMKIVPAGYFVEGSRDDLFSAMDDAFARSNVVIMTEFVGFGKRSAIKKYVQRHAGEYAAAIIVQNEFGYLRDFLLAGLEFTNLNDKLFEQLEGDALLEAKLKQLQKLDQRTLLVIPEVTFHSEADMWLMEQLAVLPCRVILLTQESADAYEDYFPVITVGRMADQHLFELFFHHYKRAYEEEQEALQEPLSQFFTHIGGHTKTVELTAMALNRDLGVVPEEVPDYLSMQGTEGLQMKERIMRHIEAIFDVDKLTGDQLTALLVAACLAVPHLSEKNYRNVLQKCGVDDFSVIFELDQRRWLDLDNQSRTVSIEPLVAQIVLRKCADSHAIFYACWDYLSDRLSMVFSVSVSSGSMARILNRIDYFCSIADLPEIAQLAQQFARNLLEGSSYNTGKMAEAIRGFEQRFPANAHPEEESNDPRILFERNVETVIRSGLLPLAKMVARGMEKVFLNFSEEGNRIMTMQKPEYSGTVTGIEDTLGVDYDELMAALEALRQNRDELDDLDQDSMEFVLLAECLTMLEHLYRRDYDALRLSVMSVLSYAQQMPQLLEEETISQLFFSTMQAYTAAFIASGAYSSAIVFCERILAFPQQNVYRGGVLRSYIIAMRNQNVFSDNLFDAYEQMLALYAKAAAETFEKREEQQREKKKLLLMYAQDLAYGGQSEAAQKQFAAAWKIGPYLLPDDTMQSAKTIVNAIIGSGSFEAATAFIDSYFDPQTIAAFTATCNETSLQILSDFQCYQSVDDVAPSDFDAASTEKKHISYYHAYSRKNNPLLEQKYCSVADKAMEFDFSTLTDPQIAEHAKVLRTRARRESPLRLAPEAFALASEAGLRVLGYRHHHVQYMGAAAMADGKIAEILNGEGKTYTIVLTAFLHQLYGKKVYVVDESSYLTRRNFNWMRGVYELLGLKCSLAEDSYSLKPKESDIVYCNLKALICGYLSFELDIKSAREDFPLDAVIVDEADTTLVDKAKIPFALTRSIRNDQLLQWHKIAWHVAQEVVYNEELYVLQNRNIRLTPAIYPLLEKNFGFSYKNIHELSAIRKAEYLVTCAILCCGHYKKGKDYFIDDGIPVQESKAEGVFVRFDATFTYFLCMENGLDTHIAENQISVDMRYTNVVSLKNFFRMFGTVCGTTATAVSYRNEFKELYNLEYVAVAPHCPRVREDHPSCLYLTMNAKDRALLELVKEKQQKDQPILLITQSVEESEKYDRLLTRQGIRHQLLNAKNADEASDILASAGVCGAVLVTNALAGRGADIKLGGNPEMQTRQELVELGEDVSMLDSFVYCLPTPEQKQLPLYKKYYSLLEKNKALCNAQRQAVLETGGLCVIGTSFFPEPRTEQQTRGRSGRQGDIGESWVFWSMEDESARYVYPPAVVEWYQTNLDTDQDVSSSALERIVKVAQQNIHNAQFRDIRTTNSKYHYVDIARADFIGMRFDLTDGLISAEDLLLTWAQDKTVLQELQKLQKGEESCDNAVLNHLWSRHEALKNARGGRVSQVLCNAMLEELSRRFGLPTERICEDLRSVMAMLLLTAWESYILTVEQTVGTVDMKEQALKNFLQQERQRLLLNAVEQVVKVRKKSSTVKKPTA